MKKRCLIPATAFLRRKQDDGSTLRQHDLSYSDYSFILYVFIDTNYVPGTVFRRRRWANRTHGEPKELMDS